MKIAVIGAGPSGLVVTKTLLQEASEQFPFDPIILEAEDDVGGTFRFVWWFTPRGNVTDCYSDIVAMRMPRL